MPLSVGIVGLPNVGKSTLFNALSNAGAEAANYPFCTIDPNVGIVPVPDPRQDALVKLISDESVDVVVVAAGQPAPLIANMRPEAQRFIKFLKFDTNHPSAKLPLPSREDFEAVLREAGGNVRAMAKHFGRDRRQIYRWLEAFDLTALRNELAGAHEKDEGKDAE